MNCNGDFEVREGFTLRLPKMLWLALEEVARTNYQGDLQKTVEDFASNLLMDWCHAMLNRLRELHPEMNYH